MGREDGDRGKEIQAEAERVFEVQTRRPDNDKGGSRKTRTKAGKEARA